MRIYYIAPQESFQTLTGVEWQAEIEVSPGFYLGWVDFSASPAAMETFEARPEVELLGHALENRGKRLLAKSLQKLSPHGVQATDSVLDVLEKIHGRKYIAQLK